MPKGVYERKHTTIMRILNQDLLKEFFDYRDGELYWKESGCGRKIGNPAGRVRKDGYRGIRINDKLYYAHRLIFLYHHGYLPKYLDHIDGDPLNNSINNLREATKQQNSRNQKKIKSLNGKPTSSIYKGVWWSIRNKKWEVQISINGKRKFLGYFISEIEAARAYNRAAIKLFGEFAKLNTIPAPKRL